MFATNKYMHVVQISFLSEGCVFSVGDTMTASPCFTAFVKERFQNAVEIDILGIF